MARMTHPFTQFRAKYRLSQADLAGKLGVSQSMVCQIEKGKKPITPKRAKTWAPILKVSRVVLCPEIFGS